MINVNIKSTSISLTRLISYLRCHCLLWGLRFFVLMQDTKNLSVGKYNLLSCFGSCKNNFSTSENEQDNFRFHYSKDKPGKGLRMIIANFFFAFLVLTFCAMQQLLQLDSEPCVNWGHDILNLEVLHFYFLLRFNLPDHFGVSLGSFFAFIFRTGASDNHLAGCKNKGGRFRLPNTYYSGGESLWIKLSIFALLSHIAKSNSGA